MRTGALNISIDLLDWAFKETNIIKAKKLWELSEKYAKIRHNRKRKK
jgi:hypothetical protein